MASLLQENQHTSAAFVAAAASVEIDAAAFVAAAASAEFAAAAAVAYEAKEVHLLEIHHHCTDSANHFH